ncbi:MAG: alpha/beta fold hydrolase [Candidatus Obscuribacter phosphatis]|uniref:Alpha/beta fold hydrolase n=1 Tax=Candidatus Obscuribacter phosphatis TaxID=1906157 RepID=A0A8J7TPD6_9BACT|nr:alpha/beta fold hydrolase [Candidatus Obscuribacter phosphatis]
MNLEISKDLTIELPWSVNGTLFKPARNSEPKALLILVHGSGPHGREEQVGGVRVFSDLAAGLVERINLAVFSFDKRTFTHQSRFAALPEEEITVFNETIDEVLTLVEHFQSQYEQIALLGHSLGGSCIPYLLANSSASLGIMLAASYSPLEDLIIRQMRYLLKYAPESGLTETIVETTAKQVETLKLLMAGSGDNEARAQAQSEEKQKRLSSELPLGLPLPYFQSLHKLNTNALAKALDKPVLLVQGERDYQVNMDEFEAWKELLSANPNFTFRSYEKLNHLFVEGDIGALSVPSEYAQQANLPAYLLDDIADFLKKSLKL